MTQQPGTGDAQDGTDVEPAPTTASRPATPSTGSTLWTRGFALLAPVLLAGWLLLALGMVLTGERSGDIDDLRADIATGEVDHVTAVGELGDSSRGKARVGLHWSHRGQHYAIEMVQLGSDKAPGPIVNDEANGRFRGDLGTYLTEQGGSVDITSEPYRGGSVAEPVFGWTLSGPLAVASWVLLLATAFHLIGAEPRPLVATRWAWFWLLALWPFGPIAYFLAGRGIGPPRTRSARIRLSGGWAFLIMAVATAAISSI